MGNSVTKCFKNNENDARSSDSKSRRNTLGRSEQSIKSKYSIDSIGNSKDNSKAFAFIVPEDSDIVNSRAMQVAHCTDTEKEYATKTYFHDCVDNCEYENISKDNTIERLIMKSKSGKANISLLIERFKCKQRLTEGLAEYYSNLVKAINSKSNQHQRMIIEIISGSGFKEEKAPSIPFIEITQSVYTLPEKEKCNLLDSDTQK